MSALSPLAKALVELMATAPRGPRRDGLFALWLVTRLVEDLGPGAQERTVRRRLLLLEKRLSSLGLAATLRRGIGATLVLLREPVRPERALVLAQLAAPAKEGVGPDVADILTRASRAARTAEGQKNQ